MPAAERAERVAAAPGRSGPMPAAAGIGLKPEHYRGLLEARPKLGFLEVHAENYMGAGGPPHRYLEALAADYPLSFHGVAASLGGTDRPDAGHLARWRRLIERYAPIRVSEHVAWTAHAGVALHDLLPLPYTAASLAVLCEHVDEMQEALGRRMLIENPSRYVDFACSEMLETEFLTEVAERTGCGLLLDVNNVYVSARNQGDDPGGYLDRIPGPLVEEIHLAGHSVQSVGASEVLIDDHGSRVCPEVWELYRRTVARTGPRPTLIEWDTDVPDLAVLLEEAASADAVTTLAAGVADAAPAPRPSLSDSHAEPV